MHVPCTTSNSILTVAFLDQSEHYAQHIIFWTYNCVLLFLPRLLDSIDPDIQLLIIERDISLDRATFNQWVAVPPHNILGYLSVGQSYGIVIRYTLIIQMFKSTTSKRRVRLTLYGHSVVRADSSSRSSLQSVLGIYVRTLKPVSNSSRGW